MLTTTGPTWLCHGNCAPGCTVYRTTTVRDGSLTSTTRVDPPFSLILTFKLMSSTKTERGVSGSAAMGGGGSCAADGSTYAPPAITIAAVTAAYFGEMNRLIVACLIVTSVSPKLPQLARLLHSGRTSDLQTVYENLSKL